MAGNQGEGSEGYCYQSDIVGQGCCTYARKMTTAVAAETMMSHRVMSMVAAPTVVPMSQSCQVHNRLLPRSTPFFPLTLFCNFLGTLYIYMGQTCIRKKKIASPLGKFFFGLECRVALGALQALEHTVACYFSLGCTQRIRCNR